MKLKLVILWLALLGVMVVLASLVGQSVAPWVWAVFALAPIPVGILLVRGARAVRRVRLAKRAIERLAASDEEGAAAAIAEAKAVPARGSEGVLAHLEAVLQLRRGDFTAAETTVEAGLARPVASDPAIPLELRALRGLLRARRDEAATPDLDTVEGDASRASASALARAALARAVKAARADDRVALRDALARGRWTMLSALAGPELLLARALTALAAGRHQGAYRTAASDDDELPHGAWIAKWVPEAASFVQSATPPPEPPPLVEPSREGRERWERLHAQRERAASERKVAVAAAVGLVALGAAVAVAVGEQGASAFAGVVGGGLVAFVTGRFVYERRAWARMLAPVHRIDLGELDRARAVLEPATEASEGTRAGAAHLYLGACAYASGELADALSHVERALPLLAKARDRTGGKAGDDRRNTTNVAALLHDQARTIRAKTLIALGRDDDAAAELQGLPEGETEGIRRMAHILDAARNHRFAEVIAATALHPAGPSLGPRAVLLGDLARVCAGEASPDERSLLEAELDAVPHFTRWVQRAAPPLWEAYRAA